MSSWFGIDELGSNLDILGLLLLTLGYDMVGSLLAGFGVNPATGHLLSVCFMHTLVLFAAPTSVLTLGGTVAGVDARLLTLILLF